MTTPDHSSELHRYENWGTIHYCNECKYFTKSLLAIRTHLSYHSSDKPKLFDCSVSTPEKFSCSECSFSTHFTMDFNKHVKIHKDIKTIDKVLQWAGLPFPTKDKLFLKKQAKSEDSQIKWFHCDKCSYKTRQVGHLNRHAAVHLEDRTWYKCNMCTYKSTEKFTLISHMNLHSGKLFSCDKCCYKTPYKKNLNRHKNTHMGMKEKKEKGSFVCDLCSHKTTSKNGLKYHMFHKHTPPEDMVWFPCGKCEFKTRDRNDLKRHSAVHLAEEDKFKCSLCSFKTRHIKYLRKHRLQKHSSSVLLD
ncbi:hypothetical protein Zmor_002461 [Zophobas morio]|uniref:C2H2-type domain-containing protein n=1 Tax=Zophobas morio TaxID=2755281 RepID=A0AA38J0T6_9CUCU|nr:hypothetical protein Zmor_002461 [Zophobas morio]